MVDKELLMESLYKGTNNAISEIQNQNNSCNIELDKLKEFHTGEFGHLFNVEYDSDMMELEEQIKTDGILEEIIVRGDTEQGYYEIISGHRRVFVANKLGLKTVPATIKKLDDSEAIKLMIVSNLTKRKHNSKMTLARAYKTYMEVNSKQGIRNDLEDELNTSKTTFCQLGTKLDVEKSISELNANDLSLCQLDTRLDTGKKAGEMFNTNRRNIFRYIRLTYLIPRLQELVENNKLKFLPAVELSYLKEDIQERIANHIITEPKKITLKLAEEIRKDFKDDDTKEAKEVDKYFIEEDWIKYKVKPKPFNKKEVSKMFPKEVDFNKWSSAKQLSFIEKAIEHYLNYIKSYAEEKEKWEMQ